MSQQLINHSPDLKRLRDEGYDIVIRANYLVLKNIPYVNSQKEIKYGSLISKLCLAGDRTAKPDNHVVHFSGEHPCDKDGILISKISHQNNTVQIDSELSYNHSFSSCPAITRKYDDYYDKMSTYATIISSQASAINDSVTAKPFPVITAEATESVFNYLDTASSRADINLISLKLAELKIGIVGLGGTGSYILDLVAKTCVKEIHLFDGDVFSQHNAFRAPGAPAIEELRESPLKVKYFREIYSKMRRTIFDHDEYLNDSNVEQFQGLNFVFLCLDSGEAKQLIVNKLVEYGITFIDVGMGITQVDGSLLGILRVTSSTPQQRDHFAARVQLSDQDIDNVYTTNIQVADLNALNAALAVIKWKKMFGFYLDLEKEHHSTYTIDGNTLTNEVKHEAASQT